MLAFESDTHIYKWNGQVVPSVTQVIGEWRLVTISGRDYYINVFTGGVVDAGKFDKAADIGTAVHKACGIILEYGRDGLDWDALAPELVLSLRHFVLWMEEWKPEILTVEESLYSRQYGYAGTSDIAVRIKRKVAVVDIKTGVMFDMAGPQVAAYGELYKENHRYRGSVGRYVLHLPKLGNGREYKFMPLTNGKDWNFFKSRLYQAQFLQS